MYAIQRVPESYNNDQGGSPGNKPRMCQAADCMFDHQQYKFGEHLEKELRRFLKEEKAKIKAYFGMTLDTSTTRSRRSVAKTATTLLYDIAGTLITTGLKNFNQVQNVFSFGASARKIQNFVLPPIRLPYLDCAMRKTEESIIQSRILTRFQSKLRGLWKDLSFPLNTNNFLSIPQIEHISTQFDIPGGAAWIYKTLSVIIVEISISRRHIN